MGRRGERRWGRRLAVTATVLVLIGLVLWFTVTSPGPSMPQPAAPTAQEVGGGRDAYRQLRAARGNKAGMLLILGPVQLAGLGAVASHGFRPDRLKLSAHGRSFVLEANRHLPLGRWLNVTLTAESPSRGFPVSRLEVGLWSLPPRLSRWALEVGRWFLSRRVEVPPLDVMVRNFTVRGGTVQALIRLPGKAGLVDQMAGAVAQPVDKDEVIRIYCALADRQRKAPSSDFAEQMHRAFSLPSGDLSRTETNRAAFIALGILLVDDRVADFAELSPGELRHCRAPVIPVTIYGRQDWPKHWTLSAAIAVGAGTQLSEAAGEWKELADSLARQSQFAIGDPSGFSMADLAADRAGFGAAQAASRPDSADRVASALSKATAGQLLPNRLVQKEDGLSNSAFVKRYGGVDDARFKARVEGIDAVLDTTGLR